MIKDKGIFLYEQSGAKKKGPEDPLYYAFILAMRPLSKASKNSSVYT